MAEHGLQPTLVLDLQPQRAVLATVTADGVADVRQVERLPTRDGAACLAQLLDAIAILTERAPVPVGSLAAALADERQPNFEGRVLAQRLGAALGLPVRSATRGASLAWAEAIAGAGQTHPDFLYFRLGDDLNGGVVLGGQPWLRRLELAHVCVDPQGPLCPCGARGCLDRYASASALDALARALGVPRNQPATARDLGLHDELARRAAAGELQVLAVIEEAVRAVGIALAHVVRMFDLPVIVLAIGSKGSLGAGLDPAALLPRIATVLARHAGRTVAVVPAQGADDAVLLGAAWLPQGAVESPDSRRLDRAVRML